MGLLLGLERQRLCGSWRKSRVTVLYCSVIGADRSCRSCRAGDVSEKFLHIGTTLNWKGRKYFGGNAHKNTAVCLDQIHVAVARSQK